MDPFGTKLSEQDKRKAIGVVRSLVEELPETTCNHRAQCCNAGCPNMTYSEYLSIREMYIDKMSEEERLELLLECVRRYITPQNPLDPKPCPHLDSENKCSVYLARPFRCRTYGTIASKLFKQMVKDVAKETGIPKRHLPLCEQCPYVKVKPEYAEKFPGGKIPQHIFKELEAALHENDLNLGIPKKIVAKGFSYLTYHDWHVMSELGERWMETLTQLRLSDSDEEKELFLEALKDAVAGAPEEEK
jgi:Fe-S-cluster containining protein